ncbi:hypothetical protein BGZ46_004769 [Entomortierella lignicola]|nr:hypothetical protein BGZ46_004769 [Entomortierella lignicola]
MASTLESNSHSGVSHSARLSYNDFEIAIKAFQRQAEQHAPWSFVEYRPRREQPLQRYLSMTNLIYNNATSSLPATVGEAPTKSLISDSDQLLLDELEEHFGDIPDEEIEDSESATVE